MKIVIKITTPPIILVVGGISVKKINAQTGANTVSNIRVIDTSGAVMWRVATIDNTRPTGAVNKPIMPMINHVSTL